MALNTAASFAVTDSTQVAEPRRAVQTLASQLGFSDERTGRAALIVSELATNLAKHAKQGEILMRPLQSPQGHRHGIELISLDKGPGIPDEARSRRDGFSTSGTLGHGLGAIARQADSVDLYSLPSGTILAARIWREPGLAEALDGSRLEIGVVQVSKAGESVCGDVCGWRMRPGRLSLFVADGLGHGVPAFEAADAGLAVFAKSHESNPARLIEDVHGALRATRGAAVATAGIDLERGTVAYAGLGNISGVILLAAGGRHSMVSHNGTAGHAAGRIQEFNYPLPSGAILVMYSDGLQSHWDLTSYPGIRTRSASVIAATIYRDFSRRRDDATVLVAKARPALTEKL